MRDQAKLTKSDQRLPQSRLLCVAISMQETEGNPFTGTEIERMCDQEVRGLSTEQQRQELYAEFERIYGIERPS